MTYLEQLNDDQSQVLTDLKIIEAFFGEQDNKLFGYYQLFTSILNANYAPYLFESLKDKVESSLEKFRIAYEGIDLTDHEITTLHRKMNMNKNPLLCINMNQL